MRNAMCNTRARCQRRGWLGWQPRKPHKNHTCQPMRRDTTYVRAARQSTVDARSPISLEVYYWVWYNIGQRSRKAMRNKDDKRAKKGGSEITAGLVNPNNDASLRKVLSDRCSRGIEPHAQWLQVHFVTSQKKKQTRNAIVYSSKVSN